MKNYRKSMTNSLALIVNSINNDSHLNANRSAKGRSSRDRNRVAARRGARASADAQCSWMSWGSAKSIGWPPHLEQQCRLLWFRGCRFSVNDVHLSTNAHAASAAASNAFVRDVGLSVDGGGRLSCWPASASASAAVGPRKCVPFLSALALCAARQRRNLRPAFSSAAAARSLRECTAARGVLRR